MTITELLAKWGNEAEAGRKHSEFRAGFISPTEHHAVVARVQASTLERAARELREAIATPMPITNNTVNFNPGKKVVDMSNARRAGLGCKALRAFKDSCGESGQLSEEDAIDLIADLLHWCDREGHVVADVISEATAHWRAEQ